jgi:hypothetical protein
VNEPKQKNRIVGRIGKAPLVLLKLALAFKGDGSPCVIDIAFIEDAVSELVAVNGDLLPFWDTLDVTFRKVEMITRERWIGYRFIALVRRGGFGLPSGASVTNKL